MPASASAARRRHSFQRSRHVFSMTWPPGALYSHGSDDRCRHRCQPRVLNEALGLIERQIPDAGMASGSHPIGLAFGSRSRMSFDLEHARRQRTRLRPNRHIRIATGCCRSTPSTPSLTPPAIRVAPTTAAAAGAIAAAPSARTTILAISRTASTLSMTSSKLRPDGSRTNRREIRADHGSIDYGT